MITYKVAGVPGRDPVSWVVVAKESGVIVAGPFEHKNTALMEANLRASTAPGNRVES